jgi:cell wall-associated NlpC family hydrolase
MLIRIVIALAVMVSTIVPSPAAERSLGDALKKIFSTPTPTPKPRKKKSAVATKKKSPTPTPTPKESATPRGRESPSPSATPSPKKKPSPSAEEESPPPVRTKKKKPPTSSPSASPHRKKKTSPSPQPFETPSASETPSTPPSVTPEVSPSPTPPKKHGAPNATLSPDQIKGFDNYPPKVQKLLTSALELTTRNLDYKYGSADPSSGGMDCSGFVYFVLKQNDIGDVPRDSSEQYSWLRRARQFESVLSQKDDSFELEDLKPGDLLFWTGTYSIERDPPITHAMIYLGREKKTGHRVMVGASDGRVYQGESRNGVSVFDFKVQRNGKADDGKLRPTFIGYGHIPGLRE